MFKAAHEFNRKMHEINIASIDVLMQLVQVVESIQENQITMQRILAHIIHGKMVMAHPGMTLDLPHQTTGAVLGLPRVKIALSLP